MYRIKYLIGYGDMNMVKVGIKKDIDKLGRIVIPKETRELFGLDKTVELVVVKEGILLRNTEYELVKKDNSQS